MVKFISFLKKVWNIIKGTFYNIIKGKQQLANARLSHCKNCEKKTNVHVGSINVGDVCSLCGCILESKVRVLDEKCDLGKW